MVETDEDVPAIGEQMEKLRGKIAQLPVRDPAEAWVPHPEHRPPGYEDAVKTEIPAPQRKKIKAACKAGAWPLLLSGDYGTGKTCAAAVVFGQFTQRPIWARADDFLSAIAQGRGGKAVPIECVNEFGETVTKSVPYDQFMGRVRSRSAVFLDDIATRQPTDPMYQSLFDLLEIRKGQPLVMTTNKTLSELAAMYDDRVADRLAAGTVVRFEGKSRRRQRRKRTI